VGRELRFAAPAGVIAAVITLTAYALALHSPNESTSSARTTATITLFIVALWVLDLLARPLDRLRVALLLACGGAFVAIVATAPVRRAFELELPNLEVIAVALAVRLVGIVLLEIGWRQLPLRT
jgi:hypothetical protein